MIAEAERLEPVVSADGTPIAVWRSGSGPPLVLVHGTTADHTRWSRVAGLLAPHVTVYAVDRRGRGGSGDTAPYDIQREAEDVAAVVAAVAAPVTLLGHSYGAICCLEAALATPAVERLVLYEPPIPVGLEIVPLATRRRLEQQRERGEDEAVLLTFFREVVRVPDGDMQTLRSDPSWPGRVAAAGTIPREVAIEDLYRLDTRRVAGLHIPVLLLLGGHSPPVFRRATEALHAHLPDSRIVELAGQQHIAMDTASAAFAAAVLRFVPGAVDAPAAGGTDVLPHA